MCEKKNSSINGWEDNYNDEVSNNNGAFYKFAFYLELPDMAKIQNTDQVLDQIQLWYSWTIDPSFGLLLGSIVVNILLFSYCDNVPVMIFSQQPDLPGDKIEAMKISSK